MKRQYLASSLLVIVAVVTRMPIANAAEPTVNPTPQILDQGEDGIAQAKTKDVAVALTPQADIAPEARVEALLGRMTQAEKLEYIGGLHNRIRAIPRLGLPEILMADGPLGFRGGLLPSTSYPAGVCVAATWDPELVRAMGVAYGKDYRAQGTHIALGPGIDIIRDPRCGRNFEYYSEDPYLSGRIGVAAVQGIQSQGVLTTLKHFACNNMETSRNFYDSITDERTLREIYLPGFKAAIAEGQAACVMTAFNKLNGTSCTENSYLNNDILRGELGFQGILMSDWTAARSIAVANGGLDLEMPTGKHMNPTDMQKALSNGTITQATVDEKLRRILRTIIAHGFLDRQQLLNDIPKNNPDSVRTSLEVARQGIVLLKNQDNLLPLDPAKFKNIAVIGRNAHPAVIGGGGSSGVNPFHATSISDGLKDLYPGAHLVPITTSITEAEAGNLGYVGPVQVEWFKNKHPSFSKDPLKGKPEVIKEVAGINFAASDQPPAGFPKTFAGRWTAKIRVPDDGYYTFVASSDEGVNVLLDGKPIIRAWRLTNMERLNDGLVKLSAGSMHALQVEWFTHSRRPCILRFGWLRATAFERALESVKQADAVVLCAGFNDQTEGESNDRTFEVDPLQQVLLDEIPRVNSKTIVTLFGGAGIDCQGWLDRVPGLLHVWYPGQEGGNAVAEILSGAVNPSGKLPLTMPKRIEDHPSYPYFLNPDDMAKLRAVYGEGIHVGYRGYDARNIDPLYPFGYGLSYTTFAYEYLSTQAEKDGSTNVSFVIKNTGNRNGAEIAQVYVAPPTGVIPRAPKELKGFVKVQLKPGESKRVSIPLTKDAFAYWNPDTKAWTVAPGSYRIQIGASSRDVRLTKDLNLGN